MKYQEIRERVIKSAEIPVKIANFKSWLAYETKPLNDDFLPIRKG